MSSIQTSCPSIFLPCEPRAFGGRPIDAGANRSWLGTSVTVAAAAFLLLGLGSTASAAELYRPPTSTLQGILVGHWQIRQANGFSLFADFQPDGTLTERIATPGTDPLMETFRRAGLLLSGSYTFTGPDMASFTITKVDFANPTALVDANQQTLSFHRTEVCMVLVVNPNRLLFLGPQGQFAGELTRVGS
jgi:hypothetical protein